MDPGVRPGSDEVVDRPGEPQHDTPRIAYEVPSCPALSHRQSEILNIARAFGRVMVEDLARRFEVSAQTIRKDLNDLVRSSLADPDSRRRDHRVGRREPRL